MQIRLMVSSKGNIFSAMGVSIWGGGGGEFFFSLESVFLFWGMVTVSKQGLGLGLREPFFLPWKLVFWGWGVFFFFGGLVFCLGDGDCI